MIAHSEKCNRAVGVAAVTDRGHVSISHDRHGGQRLARVVRMWNGVALTGRRGQLGAQCQVLLDLLILGLVEVKLGVLQVTMYLKQRHISYKFRELKWKSVCELVQSAFFLLLFFCHTTETEIREEVSPAVVVLTV